DRLFEVGCIEMIDRKTTTNYFHEFVDPEREVDEDAEDVHGYSRAEIIAEMERRNTPNQKFREIGQKFINYVNGDPLVIHNASFDIKFLDSELRHAGLPTITELGIPVFCTYNYASSKYPGRRNNLNALCDRFGIDTTKRDLHGALIDARLLAQVYLQMTQEQKTLLASDKPKAKLATDIHIKRVDNAYASNLKIVAATPSEIAAHNEMKVKVDKQAGGSSSMFTL
ncbi:exonuclease domain-containing protein, partial [Vibrio splendidus]